MSAILTPTATDTQDVISCVQYGHDGRTLTELQVRCGNYIFNHLSLLLL